MGIVTIPVNMNYKYIILTVAGTARLETQVCVPIDILVDELACAWFMGKEVILA